MLKRPYKARTDGWSDDEVESLRAGFAKGESAAVMCRLRFPDRTRNSVIGKLHRMGLVRGERSPRVRLPSHLWERKPKPEPKPAPIREVPPILAMVPQLRQLSEKMKAEEAAKAPPGLDLLSLGKKQCRWPLSADNVPPDQHRFCGQMRRSGSSYCEEHHATATVPKGRATRVFVIEKKQVAA
jgi:hypothetical protein